MSPPLPVIVIAGPTASGKSAVAITLAQRLSGEIISADAFAVYRGLNIATAKPSLTERQGIPHHLIDMVDAHERSDVTQWLEHANNAHRDLHERGHIGIVAGGTPLYTKAFLEGLSAGPPRDTQVREHLRQRYQTEGADILFAELQKIDPVYAAGRHPNDERRVIRALEVYALTNRPYSSFHTTDGIRRSDLRPLIIGLMWPRDMLYDRINARVESMFQSGLVAEIRALGDRLSPEARQAVGCKEVLAFLAGAYDEAEAKRLVARNSRHLAKHQMTWYRGWPDMVWLPGDAPDLIEQIMSIAQPFLTARQF